MLFRVLKFIPKEKAMTGDRDPADDEPRLRRSSGTAPRPGSCGSRSATRAARCGFPPGPACPDCGALDRGHVVAVGRGTVFSYVVHRHPPVPGKELPIVIALIDLDEGVRMVGEVVDVADDEIEIGMPLQVDYNRIDDDADPARLEKSADEDADRGDADPRVEPADDADHDREHRDRDPRLAGRAPRPRRRAGGRVARTSS